MIPLQTLGQMFIGGLVLFTVTLMGKPRLPALARNFAFASFCLAGLTVVASLQRGEPHPYVAALGTILFKVILIPWILIAASRHTHSAMQLKYIVRPGATYMAVAVVFAVSYVVSRHLPHADEASILAAAGEIPGVETLSLCVLLLLLGLSFMIMRRDIYSQIVGFMVMENGIVAYGVLAVGGLPLLVEIGILLTVTAGTILMAVLSRQVQEIYATGDTAILTELTD